jgi:hypothetical protein
MTPILTKAFSIVAGILSVTVFGSAILGVNYNSPFLMHLSDVVQGASTQVVASLNAPNWAEGGMLYVPAATGAATTTGTLASSTTYAFKVAALDGNGTTTLSNSITGTTDSKTSGNPAEGLIISWSAVPNAEGYAVYFGTTTPGVAQTYTQYFLATSTSGVPNAHLDFATSTGSLSGSYTKADTTAYSFEFSPYGKSWLWGNDLMLGSPTTTPQATLDIASGTVRAYSVSTSTCSTIQNGTMFYNQNNNHLWLCQSGAWVVVK